MTEPDEVLKVGRIIKPHGIEGELSVESYTDFPDERFRSGNEILLELDDELRPVTVLNSRPHQDRILLELEEISDRNHAEELRDCWLVVPAESDAGGSHSILGHELLDLTVRTTSGQQRGKITDVHPDSMNPLAEITYGDGVLDFPLSEDLIVELNPEEGFIVLDFPSGWEKLKRS
ncbi:MAG: ribosome maturation factor RimM [bacterium]